MHDWNDDRIFQRACLGLARAGNQIFLVATSPEQLPKENEENVRFLWVSPRVGLKRRIYSSKQAIELAISVECDVYHFHDPDLLLFIRRLRKAVPNSVIIYDIHENYAGRFRMWGLAPSLANLCFKMFRKYEIETINRIDGFTVVSNSMAEMFENARKPFIVIRNSTDISRLKSLRLEDMPIEDKRKIIYTSGTNSDDRDCLQTVKALPKILRHVPEAIMMFVGRYKGTFKEELARQAEIDGTSHKLVLEGMLPWEENFKRTALAYVGCVFYADNPNNRVGIPNRIFEYMYSGIPVIASDFPELRKLVLDAECGVLVDSNNPDSIADGLVDLLLNPTKAERMGKNGRLAIQQRYGYHIDLDNTVAFYKQLLENKLRAVI